MEMHHEAAPGVSLFQQISLPLLQGRTWMKVVAILLIAYGIITALSIVGILFAWLPIWMGVVLFQSANLAEDARLSGQTYKLVACLEKLKLFFTLFGVSALVYVVLTIAGVFTFFALGMMGEMWHRMEGF